MGYLGTPPQSGFITTAKQRVTSSTNNYVDLDHSISSIADVIVFVNFVKQDTTNLTLTTSTRITLGGTLVSSDVVEIHYLGKAVNTQTPSAGTVTSDMLAGSIANSKLANSSITLNGSAVSLGGSATVGGTNTPFVLARNSASQTLSTGTATKIVFDTELVDSDGEFANNRWTSVTSGRYFFNCMVEMQSMNNEKENWLKIYKNNQAMIPTFTLVTAKSGAAYTNQLSMTINVAGGDYFEIYALHNNGNNRNILAESSVWTIFRILE